MFISTNHNWEICLLPLSSTIREAILNLNKTGFQIILISDESSKILGTISDGDIRRGFLKGQNLEFSIKSILNKNPFTVSEDISESAIKELMLLNKIQQIPVINKSNQIVGLHLWDNLKTSSRENNLMVIMAGGEGKRLRPYTYNCPKPLLKVENKPILEHIILRAKKRGFCEFIISINYLGDMIEDYFKDGERHGVKISYVRESNPLGTAGALYLIKKRIQNPFIVTNGDVLTDINYDDLLKFHIEHKAAGTMAIRKYTFKNQFGVVKVKGLNIIDFEEKPEITSFINAGVYVLSPQTLSLIESGEQIDMPQLFTRLKCKNDKIIAYPIHEKWMDIGRPSDLESLKK